MQPTPKKYSIKVNNNNSNNYSGALLKEKDIGVF